MASQWSQALRFEDLQEKITLHEDFANRTLKSIDKAEDIYRLHATIYHTTSFQARTSPRISPGIQQRLQAAYIDYNVWRQHWSEVEQLLHKVLYECRSNGTFEALLEREKAATSLRAQVRQQLFASVEGEGKGLHGLVGQLRDDLSELLLENSRLVDSGLVTRWYRFDAKADLERGFCLPDTIGPEWLSFRQWVYTLPETRKSMSGYYAKSLDLLASEMLYKAPAVFWDGHWASAAPPLIHPIFLNSDVDALIAGHDGIDNSLRVPDYPMNEHITISTNTLAGDPHPSVASHAVTPEHQVVEDSFID